MATRIETIGDATLYLGDCMDILPTLDKVDAVITSPPYNLGGFHQETTKWAYDSISDDLPEDVYQIQQIEMLNAINAKMVFYNHKERIKDGLAINPIEWLLNSKWKLMQTCVIDGKSGANVDKRRFFPVHEYVYVLGESAGICLKNEMCMTSVWSFPKIQRNENGHPAAFHVDLPRVCVIASGGYSFLDPYMGSGSTGIAAILEKKRFVGIEKSPKYFDIACKRIEQASKQVDMFIEQKPMPTQETFL